MEPIHAKQKDNDFMHIFVCTPVSVDASAHYCVFQE